MLRDRTNSDDSEARSLNGGPRMTKLVELHSRRDFFPASFFSSDLSFPFPLAEEQLLR